VPRLCASRARNGEQGVVEGGIVYGDPAPSIQVASELSVLLSLDASYDEVSRGRPIAIKVALCKAARSRE